MPGINLYTSAQLAGVVTKADLKPSQLFITLFFKKVIVSKTRDIALDLIDSDETPMAAFCSPMVGSRVMRDKGFEAKTFTPGYLKPKKQIDITKLAPRKPGDEISDAGSNRDYLISSAIRQQQNAINSRKEWLAVQAVTTGRNVISGDGIETYEIDWGMNPQNIITQSGSTAWSNQDIETFDPNDDLELYAEQATAPVNVIVFGKEAWRTYRSFRRVREMLDTRRGSNSNLETALKNLGENISFKGYVGDVAIIVYSGKYTNEDGSESHYLDPMMMVFGNTSHPGIMSFGAIQDNAAVREGREQSSEYLKNYVVPGDPEIEYIQTQSAPQPIPAGIDKFVAVTTA